MTSVQAICAGIFWICAGGIFYSYGLYAALIRAASAFFGLAHDPNLLSEEESPIVSLLICAHNEEEVIERRILNALQTHYPSGKLEIAIASDGSTDQTVSIVRKFADRGVRLIEFPVNRGKATALNESIPQLKGSIIVLSDANTVFEYSAIRLLARWLANPKIVAVCGKLLLSDPITGKNADSMYWKYETFLKRCEGKLGALLGSNGAIYAIRREHFVPIPRATTIDDFVIPLLARLRFGGKIVFDEQAIAHELTPEDLSSEFSRRARIGSGGIQSMQVLWPLLLPYHGWICLTFFSHKILRWLCPVMMILAFVSNAFLLGRPIYRATFILQGLFYICSGLSAAMPVGNRLLKPLRLAAMFTGMNAALLVGIFRWIGGSHRATWNPTNRSAETKSAVELA